MSLPSVASRIKLVPIFFPNFTQSLMSLAAFLLLQFGLLFCIHKTFTHTLQFGSAQLCLVQCRQPVGLLLCTTREGAITLVKVPACVYMCVCVCVLIHRTAAHLVCPLTRQNYSTVCLTGLSPCCRRPLLGNDGRTPPHHRQVVCTH